MGDPPTINVPKVLKCKINHIFFPHKHDIPKLGGGGVPDLGKISIFSRFFGGGASLRHVLLDSLCPVTRQTLT